MPNDASWDALEAAEGSLAYAITRASGTNATMFPPETLATGPHQCHGPPSMVQKRTYVEIDGDDANKCSFRRAE